MKVVFGNTINKDTTADDTNHEVNRRYSILVNLRLKFRFYNVY